MLAFRSTRRPCSQRLRLLDHFPELFYLQVSLGKCSFECGRNLYDSRSHGGLLQNTRYPTAKQIIALVLLSSVRCATHKTRPPDQQWNEPIAAAVEIRKSSMVFPAASNSRTQLGWWPRPDHV